MQVSYSESTNITRKIQSLRPPGVRELFTPDIKLGETRFYVVHTKSNIRDTNGWLHAASMKCVALRSNGWLSVCSNWIMKQQGIKTVTYLEKVCGRQYGHILLHLPSFLQVMTQMNSSTTWNDVQGVCCGKTQTYETRNVQHQTLHNCDSGV